MDQLQHDPLTKQQIKDGLHKLLYQPIESHLKTRIDTLIVRNTLLGNYRHKSFVYKGTLYSCDTEQAPLKQNRLIPALKIDMEKYLSDVDQIFNQELPYVLGFINHALNASNSIADYLSIFPEAVHDPIRTLLNTCPCKTPKLTSQTIHGILYSNAMGVQLMKERLTLNLLL